MKTNRQKGFLTILSVILVVLIALLGRYLLELGTTTSRSVYETHLNRQALHIAHAVLKLGEHKVKEKGVDFLPQTLKGNYPFDATTDFEGAYTLKVEKYNPTTRLTSFLSATDTTLTSLDSTANFAPCGTVLIDQEIIWYQQIDQQKLLKLKRGMFGTTAEDHANGSSVTQNNHLLTATVYLPNENNYYCKKVVHSIITWDNSSTVDLDIIRGACLVSGGQIRLGVPSLFFDGLVRIVNITNSKLPKQQLPPTITTGSNIIASFGSYLETATNVGNIIRPMSYISPVFPPPTGFKNDIVRNNANVSDPQKLWSNFFTFDCSGTEAQKNSYTITKVPSSPNNDVHFNQIKNEKNWFQGDTLLHFHPSKPLGDINHPVTIIVDGNLGIYGTGVLYGAIYVTGNLTRYGNDLTTPPALINGMVVVQGTTTICGPLEVRRTSKIIQNLGWQTSNTTTSYSVNFENLSSD